MEYEGRCVMSITFEEWWTRQGNMRPRDETQFNLLRQAFNAGVESATPKWAPVSDALPTGKGDYLVRTRDGRIVMDAFDPEDGADRIGWTSTSSSYASWAKIPAEWTERLAPK
jgi:hypothetical protein